MKILAVIATVFIAPWSALAQEQIPTDALPNKTLTPGQFDPTFSDSDVCQPGFARAHRPSRSESTALKREVLARYGIPYSAAKSYELDHNVPLSLGGTSAIENLWPEPWLGPWNASVKDLLEDKPHAMVCSGEISLREAQHAIATDWISAFQRYVAAEPPAYLQRTAETQ